eukprot:COSAG02_NODE_794_length_17142_cov_13.622367_18_plen_72_part_00
MFVRVCACVCVRVRVHARTEGWQMLTSAADHTSGSLCELGMAEVQRLFSDHCWLCIHGSESFEHECLFRSR